MARRKRTVGLIAFLRGHTDPVVGMPGCANYDHHYGGCLFRTAKGKPSKNLLEEEKSKCPCLVEIGKRCSYFERAVLPTAADIGLREYVYAAYERQVGLSGRLKTEPVRYCPECGAELKPRQRYCDECSRKRRLQSKRASQQKARQISRLSVDD